MNATADEHGGVAGRVTELASPAVETVSSGLRAALCDAQLSEDCGETGQRVNGIRFTDIWFDTTQSEPAQNHCNLQGECVHFAPDGTVVIPSGFRLVLEFNPVTNSGCLMNLCEAYTGLFRSLYSGYSDAINDTSVLLGGRNPSNPLGLSNFDPINTTAPGPQVRGQAGGSGASQQLQGRGAPGGYFVVGRGTPQEQPRLMVRVPTEPSTDVAVSIDRAVTGEQVAVLRGGGPMVGDVPGSPTRDGGRIDTANYTLADEPEHAVWTATRGGTRWTQNTIRYTADDLADGLYTVNVRATDRSAQSTTRSDTLLVDGTPPVTFVTTDLFAGRATVQNAIPVSWSVFEQGSGLKNVTLFYSEGDTGDLSQGWIRVNASTPDGAFPPTVRSHAQTKAATTNVYLFMTIGVDQAGNVEGIRGVDEPIADFATALQRAFETKLAMGQSANGYRRVFIDEGDPRFTSLRIDGGRLLNYQGSDFTFVRAGAPISFEICALDAESEIGLVKLGLDHIVPGSNVPPTTITFNATPRGPCATGGTLFAADTWHLVNTDASSFPEGVWVAQFEVFDFAGNRIRVPAGNLILDHKSPTVKLEKPVLPAGQSAVKPGDVVKIRLVAEDDFGVDDAGIRVDASAFARNASALKTRPARVDGVIYQEAQFTVDLPTLQNGVFEIVVSVPDLAGNATVLKTQVAVNFKPFEFVPGSLRVSNVTHNALTLHWRTDEPTSALAKFGTTSVALNARTPQDLNATAEHALRVEGLQPSTRYFLRAVSVSAGGFTKESEMIEAVTTSALYLEPISPVSGDRVSGNVKVRFNGGLLDSTDFVSFTLEVRDSANESKPWTFLTTATRQGGAHELTWNSTRFLDGTTYQLRL
ncbi:MAG TPA: fibronectin type III domain-containing protein, partial [Candidatus Thermoplasmatota archaeon]|nr:fibronectin type III domain-containing protein [Candidatus Thermoplasmatota archaeon]